MILAAIVIARNPLQYGFDVPAAADPAAPGYDKVTVNQAVDLRRVAEWTGASISDIQTLNPELRRWTTPINPAGYDLKVPAGTAAALQEKISQAAPNDLAIFKWYTVRGGESLTAIARKLGVKRTDLASANGLNVASPVRQGQKLIIPQRESTTLLAARADRREPPAASRAVVAGAATMGEAPSVAPSESTKLIYRVKTGDSLSSIARLFDTTVQSLKLWNHLRTNAIKPGDRLTIFARRGTSARLQ